MSDYYPYVRLIQYNYIYNSYSEKLVSFAYGLIFV